MGLKGELAVITGAGSGIGRATAIRLAKKGIRIFLLGGRDGSKLEETAKLVRAEGSECYVKVGDLTELGFLDEGVAEIEKLGGADILINNAGMAFNCEFENTGEAIVDKIMNLNVKIPYFLIQKLLPQLPD